MFWNILYSLCEENNIKPNTVAKDIGVSSATCTKWKNGAIPNGETLLKLADYLNVSVDYLLGRNQNLSEQPESNQKITIGHDNNGTATINGNTETLDEMTRELIKKFSMLSFNEKIDVMNYIIGKAG